MSIFSNDKDFRLDKDTLTSRNVNKRYFNCLQISPSVSKMLQMSLFIFRKDHELPQKSGLKVIKHHIQKFEKEKIFQINLEQMKQTKDKKQRIDFKKTQTIVNNMHSSYQKHQLFNINVLFKQKSNDIDASYLSKYPKYAQYYQSELELKVILEKNDFRMTDLSSSKIALLESRNIFKDQKKTRNLTQEQHQSQQLYATSEDELQLLRRDQAGNSFDQVVVKNNYDLLEKQKNEALQAALLQANNDIQDEFKEQPIYEKKNRFNMMHNITNSIQDVNRALKLHENKSEQQQLKEYFQQALLSKKKF